MMYYLILMLFLLFTVISVDVYLHCRHRNILEHLMATNNYYEKILLLKQVISLDDVAYTREKIKNNIGNRRYQKVKDLFLHYDDDYLDCLKELAEINDAEKRLDFKVEKKKIADLIYKKDYTKAAQHIAELHKGKVLEKKK